MSDVSRTSLPIMPAMPQVQETAALPSPAACLSFPAPLRLRRPESTHLIRMANLESGLGSGRGRRRLMNSPDIFLCPPQTDRQRKKLVLGRFRNWGTVGHKSSGSEIRVWSPSQLKKVLDRHTAKKWRSVHIRARAKTLSTL